MGVCHVIAVDHLKTPDGEFVKLPLGPLLLLASYRYTDVLKYQFGSDMMTHFSVHMLHSNDLILRTRPKKVALQEQHMAPLCRHLVEI